MEYTMYETLLQLPLFQGMSKADLSEIIEKVKLNFQKHTEGDILFEQGEFCNQLVFLINGEICAETHSPNRLFSFIETFNTPMIIEPYSLFGTRPCFKATYSAQKNASILTIDKSYIYTVLNDYEVFRMNFFNMLCYKTEQLYDKIWNVDPHELEGRLIHFIKGLCTTYQGCKTLKIKMENLAKLLDDTRLNVSNVLNKWQEEGLIEMRRKEFIFTDISRIRPI